MAKITIDGKQIEVENGMALIQACEIAGVEIPRFCYHDRLKIAGNCRMCLVEVEKAPKPVASCAMPVTDGMVVKTNTPKVQQAREGVMEFLLINHPLDCPICDKGGECDLQDQSYKYGKSGSRYSEHKRSVKDKHMGPLIQTHMTRCIHCTRCIRFMEDIAGTTELGATGRGEHMEVTSYLEQSLRSELSGNIIDLCPVGALNSKPYAYTARRWELKSTNSIDVFDAMGTNIRIDARGIEVMRILPRINEDINEEWISDRIRFSYDGLKNQRIDRPYVKKEGTLTPTTFEDALGEIAAHLTAKHDVKLGAISGVMTDLETMFAFKSFLEAIGSKNVDFNQFGYNFDTSSRANYLFNTKFINLEESDLLITIGCNIRKNAPVLGARITRLQKSGRLKICNIGSQEEQPFESQDFGDSISIIEEMEAGKGEIIRLLSKSTKTSLIIGDGVFTRKDSVAILDSLAKISETYGIVKDEWNGFNILHNHASTVGALDIGFSQSKNSLSASDMVKALDSGEMDLLFLLGADEIELPKSYSGIIVYIGHHGDVNAQKADIILPSSAFTEKDASYINNEGRLQQIFAAVKSPGLAMSEYEIVLKLASLMNIKLGFSNLIELRESMYKILPKNNGLSKLQFTTKEKITKSPIKTNEVNFYLSNSILRASKTMASCAHEFSEISS
ncbi:MAG: NADH-quinone oxidoreductase subunit G [Alphaproteobacteria bacterium]|nr:NADH-quinone oxidoreductase subunit G [Alphaproteobacteria bacterium]